jgi:hypothetical protein
MKAIRFEVLWAAASVLAIGGCGGGDDGVPCTVTTDPDGTTLLRCPDGSEVELRDGTDGTNGSNGTDGKNGTDGADGTDGTPGLAGTPGLGCSATEKVGNTVTIVCPDGPVGALSDGTDGTDGTSCSVVDDPSSGKQIRCTDGTSVAIADGVDGSSCSVQSNGDGTHTLRCTDGTTATLQDGRDGVDGTSCSVADNGDGSFTMSCADGSSVSWSAPRIACSARFDDAYADPILPIDAYYTRAGVTLSGGTALLVGGVSQGDAASLGIEGSAGPAALRLDAGLIDIGFNPPTRNVAIDLLRATTASTVTVEALRDGQIVGQATVDVTVPEPLVTVRFEGVAVDMLRVLPSSRVGLDNLRYDGLRCID